jgi:hypothetical protein
LEVPSKIMSIYPLMRVWEHSQQRGTALLVLLAMADRADELGVVWAGTHWLAARARVNRRQIIRTVHYLESQGELIVMRSRKPNGQTIVNHYIIATGASDELLADGRKRAQELLEIRGGVIEDTPEGVAGDTGGVSPVTRGGVSPVTRGGVSPGHREGGTVSHDPSSYPEEEEGDPLPSASELWKAALTELGMQMTRQTFDNCLLGTLAAWDGEALVIHCRSAQAVEWLENRLRVLVERAVEEVAGLPCPVRFEVV